MKYENKNNLSNEIQSLKDILKKKITTNYYEGNRMRNWEKKDQDVRKEMGNE